MLVTSACKPKEQVNTTSGEIYSGSGKPENSLNWEGVYTGVIPCADCQGIQVRITLLHNNTYQMSYLYLGKENTGETYEGKFHWNADRTIITLNNLDKNEFPVYYILSENSLTQLDTNGNKITGELAENYVLIKTNTHLTDKHWKLTEIMGNPVVGTEGAKPAYITFNSEDNRIYGNSGCNSFSGSYHLKQRNKLVFSALVSTRMMCINMDIENKLNEIFRTIDNYTISGDTLSLNGTSAIPLARFIAK
jgi:heat shock protein HslJ